MHTVNSINDPFTREPLNIIKIPAIYHLLNNTKRQIRRKYITITNTLLFSNITSLPSSTNQHQQLTFEEAYSAKTGIRTAALLGGMSFITKKNSFNLSIHSLIDNRHTNMNNRGKKLDILIPHFLI